MSPHWHDENPWRDSVVYVPIEELAECLVYPHSDTLSHWRQHGNALDAYVLPQPSGHHDAGVRFGSREQDYLSPYCAIDKLQALLNKYRSP